MGNRNAAFRPLVPPRNLKDELIERLSSEITRGTLRPNEKLPTEQEMIAAFGVSRTVVREALAALRSEGLIDTRQGAGAFVSGDMRRRPFRISTEGSQSVSDVISIMELRLGIEIEAAGFAAGRRTSQDLGLIDSSLDEFAKSVEAGGEAVEADFKFHRAIAIAAKNPNFAAFIDFIGGQIIPRRNVKVEFPDTNTRKKYLLSALAGHRKIASAIIDADPARARTAMRRHLERGLKHYAVVAKTSV